MTEPALDAAADQIDRPVPDTPVLLNRKLNPRADQRALAVFADDRWDLTPGLFESHVPTNRLNLTVIPEPFRDAVKHYLWQLINHDAPRRLRDSEAPRLALRTIVLSYSRFTAFVVWLDSHGISRFADVTAEHLDHYLTDVLASEVSDGLKACRLLEVRRFWSYRSLLDETMRMPAPPVWDGEEPRDLVGKPRASMSNRTPRIQTDTIEMLLMWSLRFIETFADDITNAFIEYVRLWRCSPSLRDPEARLRARGRADVERDLIGYLDQLRKTDGSLPGRRHPDGTMHVHWSHLARVLQADEKVFALERPRLRRLVEQSGLAISDHIPLAVPITATLGGQPWLSAPIAYDEARRIAQLLRTACFVVIAYLSGMRTGEVLNLERGCTSRDPVTGLWMIRGRKFKGARNHEGEKIPEGQIREDPWVVVEQTVRAVEVLERLHSHRLLIPNHLHPHARYGAGGKAGKARVEQARRAQFVTDDVMEFIEWVNNYANLAGRGHERIPPDPDGRIAPSRFRRTLAWHIVRRPRGLIAGAIQYGHIHVQMTLGYSGAYDSGFPDEHAFEEWLFRLDQLGEDHQQLQSGEHVSGPAAATYRQRINAAHQKFAGRVLANTQQARDMLANPLLQIFPGRAMTCVFDQSKALCQIRRAEGDPRVTPDQDDCRRTCHNIAYTDRDINQLRIEVGGIREILDNSVAPAPRHHRAQAEIQRLQRIIDNHDRRAEAP